MFISSIASQRMNVESNPASPRMWSRCPWVMKICFKFLKPMPDCRIWRWVPSPQSIRKRYSSCLTTCAESPRLAEGAEADVPRKTISNMGAIVPQEPPAYRESLPQQETGKPPANQVQMEMRNRLSTMHPGIDHQPVAIFSNPLRNRQL